MKKTILLLIALFAFAFVFTGCSKQVNEEDKEITVAVSIVPQASFVEAVAGDLVKVVTIIPVGNSPANYQPTTKEMIALSDADIYFIMQVPTEEANILPKVSDFNEDMILVNLRDEVSKEYPLRYIDEHSHEEDEGHEEDEQEEHEEEHSQTVDPHIWLSPKRVMVMVQTIADELSKVDSANESVYQKNAKEYIAQLESMDKEIQNTIQSMDNKSFMIYHGAYGYFADDYGLNMISLEADGKAATAARMQEVIDHAKEEGITAVFYQDEFDDSQAETIAEEIGGVVKKATPLSKNYMQSIKDFVEALSGNGD